MLAARNVDVCAEYGVALALEDFVPCVLVAAAFVFLVRMVRRQVPQAFWVAVLGASLISLGGFLKATWKLLVATGCWDYPWLENLLFPFISFGFAAMAWVMLSVLRGRLVMAWPFAAFPVAAAIGAMWMGAVFPMIIAAAVGATFFGVTAAVAAFRTGKKSVGSLFVVYVVGTNVLPGIAAQDKQIAALQWSAQITNSIIQLCFLLGCIWLKENYPTPASAVVADEEKTGAPA